MKKLLLSASVLMMASAGAFAATDGKTYTETDGFTCENLWVLDRIHTEADYNASPIAQKSSRTAFADGKIVWVAVSGPTGAEQAVLHKYDIMTGQHLGELPLLTADGVAYTGTLAANTVGMDDHGHLYVAPYQANSKGDGNAAVYIVDTESGKLASVGDLPFLGSIGRFDYIDVAGDLTGEAARCDVMATCSGGKIVFGWTRLQGTDEWAGMFEELPELTISAFYPEKAENFSTAPSTTIVRSLYSETDGVNMFYADGHATIATLYNIDGSIADGFMNAPEGVVVPETGTNGLHEMTVGSQNFVVYSKGQYAGEHSCEAIVSTINENMEFSSLKNLWTIPEDGLGKVSDGGVRVHCINSVALPEVNGKQARLVVSFKCFNGLAVYKVAEAGYGSVEGNVVADATIRVNGDVISVSETAETIEVYNVAGQKVAEARNATEVAAPANGVYVVKAVVAGAPVVAKVVL